MSDCDPDLCSRYRDIRIIILQSLERYLKNQLQIRLQQAIMLLTEIRQTLHRRYLNAVVLMLARGKEIFHNVVPYGLLRLELLLVVRE